MTEVAFSYIPEGYRTFCRSLKKSVEPTLARVLDAAEVSPDHMTHTAAALTRQEAATEPLRQRLQSEESSEWLIESLRVPLSGNETEGVEAPEEYAVTAPDCGVTATLMVADRRGNSEMIAVVPQQRVRAALPGALDRELRSLLDEHTYRSLRCRVRAERHSSEPPRNLAFQVLLSGPRPRDWDREAVRDALLAATTLWLTDKDAAARWQKRRKQAAARRQGSSTQHRGSRCNAGSGTQHSRIHSRRSTQ